MSFLHSGEKVNVCADITQVLYALCPDGMGLCFLLEELKEGSVGLASEFEGTGKVMAGRTLGDRSHCLCSQGAERDERWDSAGFFMLPFHSVQTPSP